jgi:hypothetical protein
VRPVAISATAQPTCRAVRVPAPPMGQTADFYVEVDEASKGDGAVLKCNEDNNSDLTTAAACPAPG